MKCFSCTAGGDTIYFKAHSLPQAKQIFDDILGPTVGLYCSWEELDDLPEGEEYFN